MELNLSKLNFSADDINDGQILITISNISMAFKDVKTTSFTLKEYFIDLETTNNLRKNIDDAIETCLSRVGDERHEADV